MRSQRGAHTATPHTNRMAYEYQCVLKEVLPISKSMVKGLRRFGSGRVRGCKKPGPAQGRTGGVSEAERLRSSA
jgi:hypothetical protein